MIESRYPEGFADFKAFLCRKYGIDGKQVFIEYSSKPPPPVKGGRLGYYDGLLSSRERYGKVEFLITVFSVARDPLLTLGHEFAHLVEDLESQNVSKPLGPPDDAREREFDNQAKRDLDKFLVRRKKDR
jgi:hypothetical protein